MIDCFEFQIPPPRTTFEYNSTATDISPPHRTRYYKSQWFIRFNYALFALCCPIKMIISGLRQRGRACPVLLFVCFCLCGIKNKKPGEEHADQQSWLQSSPGRSAFTAASLLRPTSSNQDSTWIPKKLNVVFASRKTVLFFIFIRKVIFGSVSTGAQLEPQ